MGTCFSEIVDRSDLSKSRHGCLELITRYVNLKKHNEMKKQTGFYFVFLKLKINFSIDLQ